VNGRHRIVAAVMSAALAGCASAPNQANILLRKQQQQQQEQIADLQRKNAALAAQVRVLESRVWATTRELPESRLDRLFTVHGLSFGSLTGGFSADEGAADQMVKVYVAPTDEDGQAIKAAGAFKVELFDLAEQDTRLGTWDFSMEQARADWNGWATLYTYVLDCPWQKRPEHAKLLLRVTFTDGLTGRVFTSDKEITVRVGS
jgi:hypothetical protein